VTLDIVDVEYL